jgi:exopolyphosphatase/guanosine-5'-triphosphate,3'-diphosphate pyrophosphatase
MPARAARRIWAKMNSLIEPDVIDALYAASQAGREDRPGGARHLRAAPRHRRAVENIRVKSIVGRFLEHSRIVCFGNGHGLPRKKARVYISRPTGWAATSTAGSRRWWKSPTPPCKAQIVGQIMAANLADVAQSWVLQPDGRFLRRFAALADAMGIGPLTGVATAAVREAEDGPAFRDQVEAETGLSLRIISGAEEAQLSAQGVLLGRPTAQGLVCDIGGSSMELAELAGGRPGRCLTSPLGPLRLDAVPGGKRAQIRHIDQVMADLRRQLDGAYDTLHLVGGSWRAIARLDMERRRWPLRVLHEYAFSPDEARATLDWVEAGDAEAVRGAAGVSSDRMALVPKAAPVLRALLDAFVPSEIAMSSYGLREGLLYEAMPAVLRDRDPLIEAARFAEATSSRLPGFGKVLYQFLLPLYADAPHSRLRLIRAACLLHDTAWRAHPDYRAELCFDNATRANLGGITHPERVFLGLALMHRYKT